MRAVIQRTRQSAAPLRQTALRVLSTKVTSGATGVYPAAPSPLMEFSVRR